MELKFKMFTIDTRVLRVKCYKDFSCYILCTSESAY